MHINLCTGGDGEGRDPAPVTSNPANQVADILVFFHSSNSRSYKEKKDKMSINGADVQRDQT